MIPIEISKVNILHWIFQNHSRKNCRDYNRKSSSESDNINKDYKGHSGVIIRHVYYSINVACTVFLSEMEIEMEIELSIIMQLTWQ